MNKVLLLLAILVSSSTFAATTEQYSCPSFDNQGQLQEEYLVTATNFGATDVLTNLSIERKVFFTDLVIYKKGSNELVGSAVQLQVPAFESFENWKRYCSYNCDLDSYKRAEQLHKQDSRWKILPYQIKADNADYYTLNSEFEIVQKFATDVRLSDVQRGSYKSYESTADAEFNNLVYISNSQVNNMLYKNEVYLARVKYLANATAYSLTIDRKAADMKEFPGQFRSSVTCNK